jgi:hypothetical protein
LSILFRNLHLNLCLDTLEFSPSLSSVPVLDGNFVETG